MAPKRHTISALIGKALLITLVLTGCGDNSQTSSSNDTQSLTSTVDTEVTAPPCPRDAFTVALQEESSEPFCVNEWAVAQPQSYLEECQDCESVWLFQWKSETWQLVGRCYQFAPITPDSAPCTTPDGDELQEYPAADVACALWPANTFEENLATTNCTD